MTLSDWQIEETRKAVAAADAGDFATPYEVARVVKKWDFGTEDAARFNLNDAIDDSTILPTTSIAAKIAPKTMPNLPYSQ